MEYRIIENQDGMYIVQENIRKSYINPYAQAQRMYGCNIIRSFWSDIKIFPKLKEARKYKKELEIKNNGGAVIE